MWRASTIAAVAVVALALILGAGLASGYYGAEAAAKGVAVSDASFESISLLPQEGGFSVVLTANVSNPTGGEVTLEGVTYYVYVNNVLVGKVPGNTLVLPPSTSKSINISFTVPPATTDAGKAMAEAVRLGKANLTVKIEASVPAKAFGTLQFTSVKSNAEVNKSVEVGKALQTGNLAAVTAPSSAPIGSDKPPALRAINIIEEKTGLKVVSIRWYDVSGHEISEAMRGMIVTVGITFKASRDVHDTKLAFCITLDKKNAQDYEGLGCTVIKINMHKGETHTVYFRFFASKDVNPKKYRGFYVEIGTPTTHCGASGPIPIFSPSPGVGQGSTDTQSPQDNGIQDPCMLEVYYQQESKYPPRLKLKPEEYRIEGVVWYSYGRKVSSAVEGQPVTAAVTFKAVTMLYEYPVKICVRADKAHLPDSNVVCVTRKLNAQEGKNVVELVSFTAKHYTAIRGYLVEVDNKLVGGKWTLDNHYPPRLKYVSPSYHVVSAKWYVNSHSVTSVNKDTWVDAKVTIKTDTGLYNAKITFCVREDRAHTSDKDKACTTKTVTLPAGGEYTVTIHFKATYYKKFFAYTRGYFIKVKSDSPDYHWEMSNHYPPRLRVRS